MFYVASAPWDGGYPYPRILLEAPDLDAARNQMPEVLRHSYSVRPISRRDAENLVSQWRARGSGAP